MENNNKKLIPEFFMQLLEKQYPNEAINSIISGLYAKRKVTLRVNTIKASMAQIKGNLDALNIIYQELPWSETALIIENATEKELEELDIYKNGEIYLQSLSSMLPPIIMEPKAEEDILDMCAAPGGKTTQIAAITENKAHITACEMNTIRAERLKYNLEKQGVTSAFVMQKDSREIDDFFSFDRILLDAPCSGSGTLDLNNEETFKYFTPRLIEKTSKAQAKLIAKAVKLLKPGHEMIYSTCSILSIENEEIVENILKDKKMEIVPISLNGLDHIEKLPTKIPGTLCVCPNELYEGFFIAKLRKNSKKICVKY